MRVALLSDVHANLTALDAVLAGARQERAEAFWAMGDQVGYGPDPGAVLARLREVGAEAVLGNHDAAAAGLIGVQDFNDVAAQALAWTRAAISEEDRAYLAALPQVVADEPYTRVHGSLRGPLWEYLVSAASFRAHFALQGTAISISGHTHRPLAVWLDVRGELDSEVPGDGTTITLDPDGRRWAINPGGVGQPRDGDPRAAWALLDTGAGAVRFHRVPYDIGAVQVRMAEAELPEPLIRRLSFGR